MYTAVQKDQVSEYGNWFAQWPWDYFGTFTFGRKLSKAACGRIWKEFINCLEAYSHGRIGWIRAAELRWSGCGKPDIPLHFHALIVFKHPSGPETLQTIWRSFAGEAKVEIYDPSRGATWYLAKEFPYSGFEYDLDNLKYFNTVPGPDSPQSGAREITVM